MIEAATPHHPRISAWPELKTFILVALVFGVLTVFYMGPAITSCNSILMGSWAEDAESGGVWTAWNYKRLGVGPWPSHTPFTAAPSGESLWQPHSVTALFVLGILWLFTKVAPPVCAWNLTIFSGFVFTGLATYAVVYRLSQCSWAAFVAGFALSFSPYRIYQAESHYSYVHSALFPLLIGALLLLWIRPGIRRALAVGALAAVLGYTDPYYLLLAPVGMAAFTVAAVLHSLLAQKLHPKRLLRRILALGQAAFAAAVLLSPLAVLLLSRSGNVSVPRPRSDLTTYSARPWDYVLPPNTHPITRLHAIFKRLLFDWPSEHLHGSNFTENTLYPGAVILLLALGFTVHAARAGRSRAASEIPPGLAAACLLAIAGAAILFSFPPEVRISRVAIPMPSGLVFGVAPYWRTYARFFILAHTAIVILAGLGAALLLARHGRIPRAVVSLCLIALIGFELLTFPPRKYRRYDAKPPVYRWLADQRSVSTVAEYPMKYFYDKAAQEYLAVQPLHEKRLINTAFVGGPEQAARLALYGLDDPQTIPVLRRWRVDLLLVHRGSFDPPLPAGRPPPQSLQLVRSYPDTDVYRPAPGPSGDLLLVPLEGFFLPESRSWQSHRWMGQIGTMRVDRLSGRHRRARVSFFATSFATPRLLVITQSGSEVWRGTVSRETNIEFVARVGPVLEMRPVPGPRRISDVERGNPDFRRVSIGIWGLSVAPLEGPS